MCKSIWIIIHFYLHSLFNPQQYKLTLKGYVHGNGNTSFVQLVRALDRFRGPQCVKVISFEGDAQNPNFAWCKDLNCAILSPTPNCHVDSTVNTSRMKSQIPNNLRYTINPDSSVLEFTGFAGDQPNNGQFTSLFAQLLGDMNTGCISKVVFVPGSRDAKKDILRTGFELTLCQDPLCEVNNECVPCRKLDANKSTNGNSNSNANVR